MNLWYVCLPLTVVVCGCGSAARRGQKRALFRPALRTAQTLSLSDTETHTHNTHHNNTARPHMKQVRYLLFDHFDHLTHKRSLLERDVFSECTSRADSGEMKTDESASFLTTVKARRTASTILMSLRAFSQACNTPISRATHQSSCRKTVRPSLDGRAAERSQAEP